MIQNKKLQDELDYMFNKLRCSEDELACLKNSQTSLEKNIECQTKTIVYLKHKIKDLQQKIGSSKINC
tara:strand:- start:1556 stop:1759 length:204 start_codon:yes stop_codon:yes gene_type:complete